MKGKKILLGITGSIAAYKSALLVRLLVKEGAEVRVIMTEAAKHFITPLTLSTLSQKPVSCSFFEETSGEWDSHVDMGLWADAFIIAPASANTIGKMANGIADNLLLTTYLSAKCPTIIAPAMDLDMFRHNFVQENISKLKNNGSIIIDAESGELASGLVGKGRMAEPDFILKQLKNFFNHNTDFSGKKILITAGPTYERIDPVRFIGNFSTGKMGFALAEELANRGAEVFLISGPTNIKAENPKILVKNVESAEEMYNECSNIFSLCNIGIMCAAVADFTPKVLVETKIKSKENNADLVLELKQTKDIASELGKTKKADQVLVGFALETDNEEVNAENKLTKKNLDFIVLNSLKDKGAGFGTDTNKISILSKQGITKFDIKHKSEVAKDISNFLLNVLKTK